jgi:hypothetical protein
MSREQKFFRQSEGWTQANEKGRKFLSAKGPLRFDDWVQIAVGAEPSAPTGNAKTWMRVLRPPILRQIATECGRISDHLIDSGAATHRLSSLQLPFRVRATAQYVSGKTLAGMTTRELALWILDPRDPEAATVTAQTVADIVERLRGVAEELDNRASEAHKRGSKLDKPKLAPNLEDRLMRALEPDVIEAIERLVKSTGDANLRVGVLVDVVSRARDVALALFDDSFPVTTMDKPGRIIATTRRELRKKLDNEVAKVRSQGQVKRYKKK